MITKAIVDSIVDKYTIKVRIPRIDRVLQTSMRTSDDHLSEALICTLSNCDPNIRVGDIVFVALDDQNEDEVIILGYLYREKRTEAYCDLILNELRVCNKVILPKNTSIGDVNANDIIHLKNTKDNIQLQIDSLVTELSNLKIKLDALLPQLKEEL